MKNIYVFLFLLLITGCDKSAPREHLFSFTYPSIYFKAIDQDGSPIEGVELDITHGTNSFLHNNMSWGKYLSDKDGFIEVKIDTRGMHLSGLRKSGYSLDLSQILYNHRKATGIPQIPRHDFYQKDSEEHNKENPFILMAWRVDEVERFSQCRNGVQREFLKADGRLYGINLFNPTKNIITEGDDTQPIKISFYREPIDSHTNNNQLRSTDIFNQNWSYSLDIENGGVIEIHPDELFKKNPPKSGYLSNWVLNNSSFGSLKTPYQSSKHIDERHFYLKLGNESYARLSIRFEPLGSDRIDYDNGVILIDYSVSIDNAPYVRGFDRFRYPEFVWRGDKDFNSQTCVDLKRGAEKLTNQVFPQ